MLHAVIMAGGSGTRLWPESRAERPKQLLRIQAERSMLQQSVDRLGDLVPPERILIATTEQLAGRAHDQLSQLPREAILAEPCPRNTAPCIGLAAIRLLREDPEAVMAVMPADQVIEPAERFQAAIGLAEGLVNEDPRRLITFGIRPTYPSQGFGYIEQGEPPETGISSPLARVNCVARFHEKPDAETAARYITAGNYLWNAGIFIWKAATILEALARYEPAMHDHLQAIAAAAERPDSADVLRREFAAMDKKPIDRAVMERTTEAVVIEAPFDWDDVGSWRALERLRPPDAAGNLLDAARHVAIDTTGTILRSQDPNHVVALVGVKDLIVIVTPDATLVARKDCEESIRKVIEQLESRGWREHL